MESGYLTENRLLGSHGAGSIQEALWLLEPVWQFVTASKQGRKLNSSDLGGSCCLDLCCRLINSPHLVANLGATQRQVPEGSAKAPGLPPLHSPGLRYLCFTVAEAAR